MKIIGIFQISRNVVPSCNFQTKIVSSPGFVTLEVSVTSQRKLTSALLHTSTSSGFLALRPDRDLRREGRCPLREARRSVPSARFDADSTTASSAPTRDGPHTEGLRTETIPDICPYALICGILFKIELKF